MALKLGGLLVHRLVCRVDMVVGRPRRDGMDVQRAEVLVDVGLDLRQRLLAALDGHLLRVRRHGLPLLGVDLGHVRQLELRPPQVEVPVVHAAGSVDEPVDLRAVARVVHQSALDEVVGVDALAHADKRALVRVAAPDRHDWQTGVVLRIDGQLHPVRRYLLIRDLVGALGLGHLEVEAAAARHHLRVAVLLVEGRVPRVVGVEPPEPHAGV